MALLGAGVAGFVSMLSDTAISTSVLRAFIAGVGMFILGRILGVMIFEGKISVESEKRKLQKKGKDITK